MKQFIIYTIKNLTYDITPVNVNLSFVSLSGSIQNDFSFIKSNDYLTEKTILNALKRCPQGIPERFQIGVETRQVKNGVTYKSLTNWLDPIYNIGRIVNLNQPPLIKLINGSMIELTDKDKIYSPDLKQTYPYLIQRARQTKLK